MRALSQCIYALAIVAAGYLFVDGVRNHPTSFDKETDEIAKIIRADASARLQEESLIRVMRAMGQIEQR